MISITQGFINNYFLQETFSFMKAIADLSRRDALYLSFYAGRAG